MEVLRLEPSFAEGSLVRIRPFEDRDATRIARIFRDDPMLLMAMRSSYFPQHQEIDRESTAILRAYRHHQTQWDQIGFTVADIDSDELIGYISVGAPDDHLRESRMGPWLSSEFWGKGHFAEAAELLFTWALAEGLHAVSWRIHNDNERAIGSAKKLGMEFVKSDDAYWWYRKDLLKPEP